MAHVVATVVPEGANPFEFSVACEVFGLERPELGVEWYDFRLCAAGGSVTVNGGWRLTTPHGLDAVEGSDTVIVPFASVEPGGNDPWLLEAIVRASGRGARLVSFCSGAFALAEAGVLDGRRATTHWMHVERLRAAFPRVEVDPNVLFVDEGDVLTSAGTAAGIDLSLHLVRRDHGAEVTRYVARRMVVPPHRDGGQAQYVEPPRQPRVPVDGLGPVLEWVQRRLREPLTVAEMAERAAMSPRTFARRFREATGTTPHRWLVTQRLYRAQELLERTDLGIEQVATRSGFGTGATLRRHFSEQLDTSPSAYRGRFGRAGAGG